MKNRNSSMDIIRCVALFFVISVHFYLNSGFYSNIVSGKEMYRMVLVRNVFVTCVPLFIMLSGYLMRKRKPEIGYYKRGIKILVIYLMASCVCVLYKILYLKQVTSLPYIIKGMLDFSNSPYAWYVEMYIGLFFLIPFLNVMYNNLETRRLKLLLIVSLICLTSLSGVANVYDFTTAGWWRKPSGNGTFVQLVPGWWFRIYPITYYVIGCYLEEYKVRLNKILNLLLIIAATLISGLYNLWRSYDAYFISGAWQEYESLFTLVLAVLIFVFLADVEQKEYSVTVKTCLKVLSDACFGAYLVSWIFDNFFYAKLSVYVADISERFQYFWVIVPIIYASSLGVSIALNVIYRGVEGLKVKWKRS